MYKKIAICISGIPKFWTHAKNSIQKYFPNADVFVHMWNIDESTINNIKNGISDGLVPNNHGDVYRRQSYKNYTQLDESTLINNFSPKKYVIEDLNNYKSNFETIRQKLISQAEHLSHASTNVAMISMFYGIEQATQLKKQYELENNFKYDIVIRMRFDSNIHPINNFQDTSRIRSTLMYSDQIIIQNKYWWLEFDQDTVVIPVGNDYDGLCDQFWFTSSNLFDEISYVYSNLENIIKLCKKYHPETVFKYHLKDTKIKRIPIFIGINNL